MYGPRKYLHGPHMPPEHVPDRLDSWSFTHRAMPMTVSFNMQLEKKFPDWFAFVRSHKTRFVCCNASIFGNGLDEEFLRVYPAMLYKLDAGDQLPKYSLKTAALHGTACNCENKECIKSHLAKLGAIAIQSCTAQGWRFASNLLDRVMENSKVAGAPPVSLLETDMETDEATGVRRAILASISAADVALALCACWVISSAWCSLSSVRFRFLGLTTFLQVVLLLSFIAFGVGHVFVMQRAGTTGYSLISATILIYVGKCVVSFLMFLGRTDLKAGFSTLGAPGCTRFGKVPAFAGHWRLPHISEPCSSRPSDVPDLSAHADSLCWVVMGVDLPTQALCYPVASTPHLHGCRHYEGGRSGSGEWCWPSCWHLHCTCEEFDRRPCRCLLGGTSQRDGNAN